MRFVKDYIISILLLLFCIPFEMLGQQPSVSPLQAPQVKFIQLNRSEKLENFVSLLNIIETDIKAIFQIDNDDISPFDFWARQTNNWKKNMLGGKKITHLIEGELKPIADKIRIKFTIKDPSLKELHPFPFKDFSSGEQKSCKKWSLGIAENIHSFIHGRKIKEKFKIIQFQCENENSAPMAVLKYTTRIPKKLLRYLKSDEIIKTKYTFNISERTSGIDPDENEISGILTPMSGDSVKVQIFIDLKSYKEIPPIELEIQRKELERSVKKFAEVIIRNLKQE